MLRVLAGLPTLAPDPFVPEISALWNRFQYRRVITQLDLGWHTDADATHAAPGPCSSAGPASAVSSLLIRRSWTSVLNRPSRTERTSIWAERSSHRPSSTPTCTSRRPGSCAPVLICDPQRRAEQVLDAVATASIGGAVLGGGWDEHGWPDPSPPTAAELQRAAGPDAAVWLARVDGHSSIVSRRPARGRPGAGRTARIRSIGLASGSGEQPRPPGRARGSDRCATAPRPVGSTGCGGRRRDRLRP